MGLFDSLASKAIGALSGADTSQMAGADVSKLVSMFSSGQGSEILNNLLGKLGGLGGLMEKLKGAGLGDTVSSWVGKGENQPIEPEQLQSALGDETVTEASTALGIDASALMPMLSKILPGMVDQLTPNGQVEAEHLSAAPGASQIQDAINAALPGGLGALGKLFG